MSDRLDRLAKRAAARDGRSSRSVQAPAVGEATRVPAPEYPGLFEAAALDRAFSRRTGLKLAIAAITSGPLLQLLLPQAAKADCFDICDPRFRDCRTAAGDEYLATALGCFAPSNWHDIPKSKQAAKALAKAMLRQGEKIGPAWVGTVLTLLCVAQAATKSELAQGDCNGAYGACIANCNPLPSQCGPDYTACGGNCCSPLQCCTSCGTCRIAGSPCCTQGCTYSGGCLD